MQEVVCGCREVKQDAFGSGQGHQTEQQPGPDTAASLLLPQPLQRRAGDQGGVDARLQAGDEPDRQRGRRGFATCAPAP